jgi:hypothetical protein
MTLKNAIATNIIETRQPIPTIINPMVEHSKIINGIPAPITKASINDMDRPMNKLNQILFLSIG